MIRKLLSSLSLPLTSHLLPFPWLWNGMIRNALIKKNVCTSQCSCEDQICENVSTGIKFDTKIINVFFYLFLPYPLYITKHSLETLLLPAVAQAGAGVFNKLIRQPCRQPITGLSSCLRTLFSSISSWASNISRHVWQTAGKQKPEHSFQENASYMRSSLARGSLPISKLRLLVGGKDFDPHMLVVIQIPFILTLQGSATRKAKVLSKNHSSHKGTAI